MLCPLWFGFLINLWLVANSICVFVLSFRLELDFLIIWISLIFARDYLLLHFHYFHLAYYNNFFFFFDLATYTVNIQINHRYVCSIFHFFLIFRVQVKFNNKVMFAMPCSLDDDCFTKVRLAPCEPTHYSWLDFKLFSSRIRNAILQTFSFSA